MVEMDKILSGGGRMDKVKQLVNDALDWEFSRRSKRSSVLAVVCPECNGEGIRDSGGINPDGSGINIPCELCQGSGDITPWDLEKAGWKRNLDT